MREDKTITCWPNGNIRCIRYTDDNGYAHNLKSWAVRYYSEARQLEEEHYAVNGKLHRLDGPAYIKYNKNGEILDRHFYIDNIYIPKENFAIQTAKPVEKKPAIQIEFKVLVNGKEIVLSEERLTKLTTALID